MLNRFLSAQENSYNRAFAEICAGKKQTHWIWYLFPQLQGLGKSETARFYGLKSRQEAADYLAHPVLGARLCAITEAVLAHRHKTPLQIFGHPDDLKFHSCMTLFNAVSPAEDDNTFAQALDLFFAGIKDSHTLTLLDWCAP